MFVNLSRGVYDNFQKHLVFFEDTFQIENFSRCTSGWKSCHSKGHKNFLHLTLEGKEMLMWAYVLPLVEQLKLLQGYSRFAMAAIVAQGIDYIYGILVHLM